MTPLNPMHDTPNLLEAYRSDPLIRSECNEKGLYVNFNDEDITVTMYLTDYIEQSSHYHEFSEICGALTADDTIVIFADNGGGYLSGAQMFARTLANCAAYSLCIGVDTLASAMTIIALQCDELRMEPHSSFMIHSPTWGEYPKKLHEFESSMEFSLKQTKYYMREVYKDFLTPEEIEHVISGGDLYYTADETMERFNNIQERRLAEHVGYEQENTKAYIEGLQRKLAELEDSLIPEVKPKVKPKAKPKTS